MIYKPSPGAVLSAVPTGGGFLYGEFMNESEVQYKSSRRMAEINNAVIQAIVKCAKQEYPNKGVANISAVRHCAWCICAINMIGLSNEDFSKSLRYLSRTDLISISETDETVSISLFASEAI